VHSSCKITIASLPETIEKHDQVWKYALFSTKAGKFLIKQQAMRRYTIGDYALQSKPHKNPHNRKTATGVCYRKLLMLLGDGPNRNPTFMNPPEESAPNTFWPYLLTVSADRSL
jgi:hypothetical protein